MHSEREGEAGTRLCYATGLLTSLGQAARKRRHSGRPTKDKELLGIKGDEDIPRLGKQLVQTPGQNEVVWEF